MRRLTACALSALLAVGVLSSTAPEAHAADLGTVTISYSGGSYVLTPTTIAGQVNDTFTFTNAMTMTDVTIRNLTGQVRSGATVCTSTDCRVNRSSSVVLTIDQIGTVEVRNAAGNSVLETLTISAASSSGSGSGAAPDITPTYTATINANGGDCSGPSSYVRIQGNSAFSGVFELPSTFGINSCIRLDYKLLGWATNPAAPEAEFGPGATYTMGDSDVTLFAVWEAQGVLIRYDSNVGMDVQCLTNGVNQATREGREDVRIVAPFGPAIEAIRIDPGFGTLEWNSQIIVQPVCSPPGHTFLGWSTSPSGSPATAADNGKVITGFPAYPDGRVPNGRQVTLYAQWGVPNTQPAVTQGSISITGDRDGNEITVEGVTTGIAPGKTVVAWIRFPGQSNFSEMASRPIIRADGSFTWYRKTGKKTTVYFTLPNNPEVQSNRVIISAR